LSGGLSAWSVGTLHLNNYGPLVLLWIVLMAGDYRRSGTVALAISMAGSERARRYSVLPWSG
jgi:hypothetical protein